MNQPPRRKAGGYFAAETGAPHPLVVRLEYRVRFSEVDPMAVLWHGRYSQLFEQANEELGRLCGLGYADFQRERLMAPVVQLHVDYFAPVALGERVSIVGRMMWTEAARLNIEYEVLKEGGALAASGYTVQMFVDDSGVPLLACPAILQMCQNRWRAGEFDGPR